MSNKQKDFILAIAGILVMSSAICCNINKLEKPTNEHIAIAPDAIPATPAMEEELIKDNPQEYLYEALIEEEIKEPDIVYAQAILETGNFTSRICIDNHNLFGLYDSVHNCYYKFDSWKESVVAYKELVEKKYKGGSYYHFLDTLPYSTTPDYVSRVKRIVKDIQRI